ncbi:MAG: serine hydrolase domain-containing protein [Pirellulaceae bacterium]|nr:serine hydrolase domain-containing protein [Pirellulaceae bacterium]
MKPDLEVSNRVGWLIVVALVSSCLTPGLLSAQVALREETTERWALDSSRQQKVDQAVMEEMERQKLVGVAIGVIEGGEVAYVKGYGWANREAEVPLDETTVINWASNSKPVSAVIAAGLVKAGRLDLDADIRTYLPDFPDKGQTITTRQLLCHQSGMPHYSNGRIVPGEPLASRFPHPQPLPDLPEWDPAVAVARFVNSPLIHQPGHVEDYSSYAYVLLSAVLQAAADQSLHEQIQVAVIEPLQLSSFQLDMPWHPSRQEMQAKWAAGYRRLSSGNIVVIPDVAHYWKHAAGGYKSNANDFSRWAAALLGETLMDKSSKEIFWKPQQTADGKIGAYGLGFAVDGRGQNFRVAHGGSQDETKTRMVLYPEQRRGVVVMSNCNHADPGKISTAVFSAIR